MKRTQRKQASTSGTSALGIDAAWLSTARGGVDLAVDVAGAPATYVPTQHNELLVTR